LLALTSRYVEESKMSKPEVRSVAPTVVNTESPKETQEEKSMRIRNMVFKFPEITPEYLENLRDSGKELKERGERIREDEKVSVETMSMIFNI
jgi:hypothetical protein